MISKFVLDYNLQDKVDEIIQRIFQNESILQTYLFYGEEGTGKFYYAINFVMTLFCTSGITKPCGECYNCKTILNGTNPDVKIVQPKKFTQKYIETSSPTIIEDPLMYHRCEVGDSISIDSIREVKEYLSVSSFNNGFKVLLINNFDFITTEASNAFLKMLEEPAEKVIIILTANKKRAMLDTILSRIQLKLFFGSIKPDLLQTLLNKKHNIELDNYDQGSYLEAIDAHQTSNKAMDLVVREIVDFVFGDHARDENYSQNKISLIIEKISPIDLFFDSSQKNNVEYVLTKFYDIYHKKVILNEKWNSQSYEKNSKSLNSYAKIEIVLATEKAIKMLAYNVNPLMSMYRYLVRVAKILNNKIFDEELI